MNDIDDDRDELAFAHLDLARYHSLPWSWSRPCARRPFEPTLQDQHLLRRVGALFGAPGIARDGDQNDPTGNIWERSRFAGALP